MSHIHEHTSIVTDTETTSLQHHDYLTETGTVPDAHGGLQMMMMAMTFHGGYQEAILFDQWKTKTVSAFVGSCFAIFFLAVFCEGVKTFRNVLAQCSLCAMCSPTPDRSRALTRLISLSHMNQTLLHIIQMIITYLLMLIAMTFNTYLFIAVVLGSGVGHLLFGWRRSSAINHNEHCH